MKSANWYAIFNDKMNHYPLMVPYLTYGSIFFSKVGLQNSALITTVMTYLTGILKTL